MEKTCKDIVQGAFNSRMADIRKMYAIQQSGERVSSDAELPPLNEYGLSIDHVKANTFKDQPQGYWRYQLSWGGPSEEFRMYTYGRMEFWYLDWFDGAMVKVTGRDAEIIRAIIKGNE